MELAELNSTFLEYLLGLRQEVLANAQLFPCHKEYMLSRIDYWQAGVYNKESVTRGIPLDASNTGMDADSRSV